MKHKKILFVCTGNTCRSPMAEALLRAELKKRKIKWWDASSCGIRADVGGKLNPNSKTALEEVGITMPKFKPRQITQKLVDGCTLLVTMTSDQVKLFEERGNVRAFKEICGYDIPDPYGMDIDVYRQTRDDLTLACHILIEDYILKYEE